MATDTACRVHTPNARALNVSIAAALMPADSVWLIHIQGQAQHSTAQHRKAPGACITPAYKRHFAYVQSLVDVEEQPGGAVSNYIQISDIVRQMQENVDAMHACHSYYISHAYTQVRIASTCFPAPTCLSRLAFLLGRMQAKPRLSDAAADRI